jgi:hypothetical protein
MLIILGGRRIILDRELQRNVAELAIQLASTAV